DGLPMIHRLVFVLAILAAPLARAGVTLTMEHKGESSGKPSTVYLEADRMRVEDGHQIMIFDASKQTLTGIEAAAKSYSVMTAEDAKRAAAEMRKAMQNLPPEQRKQMEALVPGKSRKTEQIKLVKLGGHKTVAGYACDEFRVMVDGKPAEEGCYIPWSD